MINVKNFGLLFLLGLISIGTTSCGLIPGTSQEKVSAGYAGLKIQLYGDGKGIDNAELVSGNVWYNGYTEDVAVFPTFINTYTFTKSLDEGKPVDESVQFSVGGSPVNADVSVAFGFGTEPVDPKNPKFTKLHRFYKTYRKEPDDFRAGALRAALRSCFTTTAGSMRVPSDNPKEGQVKLTPSSLSDNQTALVKGAKDCLQAAFPDVLIQEVFMLGLPRMPVAIQKSIDEKFAAQQAAQTATFNQKKVEAESASKVAQAKGDAAAAVATAKGQAEANLTLSKSLTPELLQLKRIEIEEKKWDKWDGQQAPTIQTPNIQLGQGSNQKP